jgi:PIN domain nuclease of toxin-antitoxin system
MKLLLDTHIFLWYISGDASLPISLRDDIRDANNEVYLSAASVWEVVIKFALGKLPLPEPPATYLPRQRASHHIAALPIDEGAFVHLHGLPPLHRDPFDRLLLAQALQHGLTIITLDVRMRAYPVSVLSAP